MQDINNMVFTASKATEKQVNYIVDNIEYYLGEKEQEEV